MTVWEVLTCDISNCIETNTNQKCVGLNATRIKVSHLRNVVGATTRIYESYLYSPILFAEMLVWQGYHTLNQGSISCLKCIVTYEIYTGKVLTIASIFKGGTLKKVIVKCA